MKEETDLSGTIITLNASTIDKLEKKVRKTIKEARPKGLIGVRQGWDPKRVVKTENGYEITIWVHNAVIGQLISHLLEE